MSESSGDMSGNSGQGEVRTVLSRDISLFNSTFIGVGAVIGAGVFALTGFAAGIAGPALVLAFALNGFVALFTAVSYAELGAAFPKADGGYLWVKEALVGPNGFVAGRMSWYAHAVTCSLYAVTRPGSSFPGETLFPQSKYGITSTDQCLRERPSNGY